MYEYNCKIVRVVDGVKKKVKFKRYLSPDSLTNPITRIIGGFKKPTKGDIE